MIEPTDHMPYLQEAERWLVIFDIEEGSVAASSRSDFLQARTDPLELEPRAAKSQSATT